MVVLNMQNLFPLRFRKSTYFKTLYKLTLYHTFLPRLEVERRGYDIYIFGERVSIEIMLFLSDKFFLILFFLIFICPLDHCAADSRKIYNLCSSRPQMHHNRIEKNCPTSFQV